ncbi:glycoside hydrolase [Pseudovirgaria hyperparasitica]|uniref:Beta-mannosidase A n=1 Tax=Pseudovirgaria hyperparasitica TaxID=470096 RepID=A0A6A6WMS5_9PEZI|nr:glycoside hydrolase [Pseudovirgaria hyperparasitica]KAF2763537.1 glycoside hydrolase [Pseudovirgaria hyperparasitica]
MLPLLFPLGLYATVVSATFIGITSGGAEYVEISDCSNWRVANANGTLSFDATVPGLIHTDLYAAGIIADPLYGDNFATQDWIAADNWTYSRKLPDTAPSGKKWTDFRRVYLVFEGLDTIATVNLGGEFVGFANNQFRQWVFDATSFLTTSSELEVKFQSAIQYALYQQDTHDQPYTLFTNYGDVYPFGREFIRKIQSDFGWDWGPHFAPQGIYKQAYLVGLDDGIAITNTFIDIYKDNQRPNDIFFEENSPWTVNVSIDYLSAGCQESAILGIDIGGHNVSTPALKIRDGHGRVGTSLTIADGDVERWWPWEFGTPHMYNASICLQLDAGAQIDFVQRTAFRTIVMDLTPYNDRPGNHFSFRINGHRFNTKGINMVPIDPFEQRVNEAWARRLLEASVASNYNMIRLWASGNYYPDYLYDVADELGILLWSDFQFSDNYYPVWPEFLENVQEEVRYQMRRLNHHPSLAVWAGGNEMERYAVRMQARNETYGEAWFDNYTTLFVDTIWPEVYQNTRSISWLQASDTQGYESYDSSTGVWIPKYTDQDSYGNRFVGPQEDYYLKVNEVFNNSVVLGGRFVVEYGMFSWDSYESYRTVLPESELVADGEVLLSRCYDGGPTVYPDTIAALQTFYGTPTVKDPTSYFDQVTWLSQIYHAEILKFKTESYRRGIGLPENNLGALVWQLNAPWTTLALNTIEYTGRWKVPQYITQQIFSRVAVSSWFEPSNNTFNIWMASDLWTECQGTVEATWATWAGETVETTTHDFTLANMASGEVVQKTGWETILPQGYDSSDVVLLLKATATDGEGKQWVHENFWVPNQLVNATLHDPCLELKRTGDGKFTVTANNATAAYVWLTEPAGVVGFFDQNAVFLAKGETRTFKFIVQKDETDGVWQDGVKVRSFWDNFE